MTAFCVFGISYAQCKALAEKNVESYDAKEKRTLTQEEFAERVEQAAKELFEGGGETKANLPSIRRAAVLRGLDPCRAQIELHPAAEGHDARRKDRQARRAGRQQGHRPCGHDMGSVRTMISSTSSAGNIPAHIRMMPGSRQGDSAVRQFHGREG
jgi:hypothetical protein